METILRKEEDLLLWSRELVKNLIPKEGATIITFSGDLGAGKTTSIQKIAEALGIEETVTSPTFVIQKEYSVASQPWIQKLIHIDAYRLESKEELEHLGWNELIKESGNLICIEWPSRVLGIALPKATHIALAINADHTRTIKQTS